MPLPFLKPKKIASVIIARHSADGSHKVEGEEGESLPKFMDQAERMMKALKSEDIGALASVLQEVQSEDEKEEQE
jgi:hypothetical protein